MAKDEIKKVDEVTETPEIKKVAEKPIVVKEKMVKVIPKFSGVRFIGGERYEFKKDKEISVSVDAKRSLLEAGAIYL